jgi:biopolymer transport protein TolR
MQRSKARSLISDINVVPYVDVMLVLLVIFMITAPLLTQGVVVDLPDVPADPVSAPPDEPLILSVDAAGAFYLNFGGSADEALDEDTVLERASAVVRRNPATPIFVRGDERAVHGRVMLGIALLQQAGARQVVLPTELPAEEVER